MRRAFVTTCVLLGLWLAAGRSGHGIPVSEPRQADYLGRLSALEERLFEDAADGQLDEFSLLDAALIAGGLQRPEELKRRRRQLAERHCATSERSGVGYQNCGAKSASTVANLHVQSESRT